MAIRPDANANNVATVLIAGQAVPHTNYVARCQSSVEPACVGRGAGGDRSPRGRGRVYNVNRLA
ncbi:hypothetical protein BST28_02445 [Mycolicibacter kumamotonensis]|uniref:Uncharacterized protein n=1 Tax=Mycolicibacter kumamotonensis TaxID=354243 RepID=A0A1X0EEM7_9MYCO|nr:hypothetical protein [Mycolicibacter kumamotonensis]ORA83047.1 hypothetical protein BST28_02445 [Mycolicibacter kumamotonensis]